MHVCTSTSTQPQVCDEVFEVDPAGQRVLRYIIKMCAARDIAQVTEVSPSHQTCVSRHNVRCISAGAACDIALVYLRACICVRVSAQFESRQNNATRDSDDMYVLRRAMCVGVCVGYECVHACM